MRRRWWVWAGQGILAALVVVFVARALSGRWREFMALEFDFDARFIVLAAFVTWASYTVLIEAWRRILVGWRQRLPFAPAARIWCVANLGRYLPGKVWGIAGLAVLAQREGVSGWAAAGSALAMQALAVGTGAAVVALATPQAVSPIALVLAAVMAAGTVALLTWRPGATRLARLVKPDVEIHVLPGRTALAAGLAAAASWAGYGLAFWLLAQGLLPGSPIGLRAAVGVFAAGYLVGFLAIFAPGGVGVRELVFVALLTPTVGGGGAIVLSVASRLLLTVTEVGAALAALTLGRRSKEMPVDPSRF